VTACRRRVVLGAAAALAAGFGCAFAQTHGKVWRIGYLNLRAGPAAPDEAFVRGMRDLGYVVGRNLLIEYRWAASDASRMQPLADELVQLNVDVIVTAAIQATSAAMRATNRIPIVMAAISDPVGLGLVGSLRHPGGNVTGMTLQSVELARKRLQLVREMVPAAKRVGVVTMRIPDHLPEVNRLPARLLLSEMEAAAGPMGIGLVASDLLDAGELPAAFAKLQRAQVQAVFVQTSPATLQIQAQIADEAARQRLPTMYELRSYVEAGGLVSYGPDLQDMYRRAASFVDRIFKGAKPGDLPIDQPEKLELVINLKAAQPLGLTIPRSLLLRADEVIR